MIRKRDFALFVSVLLFLLIGLSSTLIDQIFSAPSDNTATVVNWDLSSDEVGLWKAESVNSEPDRQSFIERMKAKLNNSEGDLPAAVLTSVDQVATNSDSNPNHGLLLCGTDEAITLTELNWPINISLKHVEGVILVQNEQNKTLLQLPQRVARNDFDTCIGSDVVGVNLQGDLIFNSQVAEYYSPQSRIVGYARDGFPIYSGGVGESELDSCGGYATAAGYAYYLTANGDNIISCYAGTPTAFIE